MQNNQIVIYCDGGSRGNPGPAASAFVVEDSTQNIIFQKGVFLGNTTNNQAEYQAVIEALTYLSSYKPAASVLFRLDSQLVVNQINNIFKIKDSQIKIKYDQVKKLLSDLKESQITFSYIPRAQNFRADQLVNQTLDKS